MVDCSYCGESFADEGTYLEHLHSDHDDETLSRIDSRRVEEHVDGGGSELPTGPLIIAGLIVFTGIVLAYVTFGMDGGASRVAASDVRQTPTAVGSDAAYGTINLTIDGTRVDFSGERYQIDDPAFTFLTDDEGTWRTDADNVTLEYALATVGIGVTETSVSAGRTTYRDADGGTSVTVEVDGQSVDPSTYVLEGAPSRDRADEGDHVRIVVETSSLG